MENELGKNPPRVSHQHLLPGAGLCGVEQDDAEQEAGVGGPQRHCGLGAETDSLVLPPLRKVLIHHGGVPTVAVVKTEEWL